MIIFKEVTMQNFLAFGQIPVSMRIDLAGTTLITGKNGVGKTSIMNAIVYTLYDKPLTNGAAKKDNLINNVNKKEMETTLSFEKNGIEYLIRRARKMRSGQAGNYVHIFKDGKDITPDSIGNGNKLIESIVGIPYDLFIRIATVSATYTPFLDLPVKSQSSASQTGIIEELFDLTSLSEKAEILKEQIKETKHAIELQESRREALESERERYESQLASARKRKESWETNRDSELKNLSDSLVQMASVDIEAESAVFDELENIEKEASEFTQQLRELRATMKDAKAKRRNSETEMKHLSDGKCPYCKQVMENVKSKLESAKKTILLCDRAIEESEKSITELDDKVETTENKIRKLRASISVSDVQSLYKLRSKIEKYEEKLDELRNSDNPHSETLDELLAVDISDFDMESINELDDLLKHQSMVLKLLTKKDSFVRKNLINKSIPYLNGRLNHYLGRLELTQIVEFKHDMTATISKFGRALDFGNLSNGQKSRINLAMSFAFRDVLQNMHGQINICMLDEVLDVGLDPEGVTVAANMLQTKGKEDGICIFIVTHRQELKDVFDRKIQIIMENDFSIIQEIDEDD